MLRKALLGKELFGRTFGGGLTQRSFRRTYLEGLGNKFIDEIYGVPDVYEI